jgi:hypothetical protein
MCSASCGFPPTWLANSKITLSLQLQGADEIVDVALDRGTWMNFEAPFPCAKIPDLCSGGEMTTTLLVEFAVVASVLCSVVRLR